MKSPNELANKLARQWQNPNIREGRLLNPDNWPIKLSIGRPTNKLLSEQTTTVKNHLDQWRDIGIGKVYWEDITFRTTGEPIRIPVYWELNSPSQWVTATGSTEIKYEFKRLEKLAEACPRIFHKLLIRQRHLINNKPAKEIIRATRLAMELEPGCAKGRPLRTLSLAGIDSKFFERHRTLVSKLLDIRFDNMAGELGLEAFLGALDENDHWLLLADLDSGLLPFDLQRVRAKEICKTTLPGKHLLVVENEKCLYHLPPLKDTLAILGAGLNLSWLQGPNFSKKSLGYWGDIDTWGLAMLAKARCLKPDLTPLLMTKDIFNKYRNDHAVEEKTPASLTPPEGLTNEEIILYNTLLPLNRNRLEQEFLPNEFVATTLRKWTDDFFTTK